VTAVLTLLAFVAAATLQPPADSTTGANRFALAVVLDPRNRPIVDVGADDFVIQEAGVSREVLSVRPADYPVVVMLDTGIDARGDFALMKKAAAHFIDRIGPRPLAIGTFGGTPKMIVDFDDDRESAIARLGELAPGTNEPSELLAGASVAAGAIRRTGALFTALIMLSSAPRDSSQASPDAMVASIIDSGAILHVVANRASQPAAGGGFRPGAAIRALTEQSRGEYTTIFSAASYQAALDRLADRLTTELLIEYLVPVGSKPNDVKLGVRIVGAHVRGLGVAPR